MDLELSEDQRALTEAFADFFTKESTSERIRTAEAASGVDDVAWGRLRAMGGVDMALPEAGDGGGLGLLDLALVAEQAGKRLAAVPMIEAQAALRALATAAVESDTAATWLTRLRDSPGHVGLALAPAADGEIVAAGASAVGALVLDATGDEERLCLVDAGTEPVANLGGLGLSRLVPGSWRDGCHEILSGPRARAIHDRSVDEWRVLTAAYLGGLAVEAVRIGVDYAKERKQFGRPIGSFQAVAHRLADAATAADGAVLLAYEAAWAADEGLPRARRLGVMAYAFAGQTAVSAAADSLHVHGGYGFMLEYDIQLYFRRAKALSLLLGDPRAAVLRIGDDVLASGL